MKRLIFTTVILIALSSVLFQMSSCKKQDPIPTPIAKNFPIEGLWIGTYTVDGQTKIGEQYFSLIVKPDSTVISDTKWITQQHLGTGNWSLNGNIFSCSFTCVYGIQSNIGITETATATWDNTGKLTGTWKNAPPYSGTGVITLTRIN